MPENNKILLIKGQSQYGVLRKAADYIARGFLNKGYSVTVMDLEENEHSWDAVIDALSGEYAFIFSCQAIGLDISNIMDKPLPDIFTNTYIGWIFDDAIYHYGRLRNACYPYVYVNVIDRELLRTIPLMVPDAQNISYLPHGGFINEHNDYNKTIDILFPATISAEPVFEQIRQDPMPIELLLIDETKKVLADSPELSIRKALNVVLHKYDITLTTELILELQCVLGYLDQYTRYFCKVHILEALLEKGFTVHVMGSGERYGRLKEKYSEQLIYMGAMDIDSVIETIGHTKVIMNPCSIYSEGFHERIFTAFLNKTVCFTPYSSYVAEHMGNRLQYIHLNHLEAMARQVGAVLENWEEYNPIIEDNYTYAISSHTWEKRGEEIIDRFEQLKG